MNDIIGNTKDDIISNVPWFHLFWKIEQTPQRKPPIPIVLAEKINSIKDKEFFSTAKKDVANNKEELRISIQPMIDILKSNLCIFPSYYKTILVLSVLKVLFVKY
jgi:hypothetical protein